MMPTEATQTATPSPVEPTSTVTANERDQLKGCRLLVRGEPDEQRRGAQQEHRRRPSRVQTPSADASHGTAVATASGTAQEAVGVPTRSSTTAPAATTGRAQTSGTSQRASRPGNESAAPMTSGYATTRRMASDPGRILESLRIPYLFFPGSNAHPESPDGSIHVDRIRRFLAIVPSLAGRTRRELRVLSHRPRLALPAGHILPATPREVVLVARGRAFRQPDGSLHPVTPVRLLVLGYRELRAVIDEAPHLACRFLNDVGTTRESRVALPDHHLETSSKVTPPTTRSSAAGELPNESDETIGEASRV